MEAETESDADGVVFEAASSSRNEASQRAGDDEAEAEETEEVEAGDDAEPDESERSFSFVTTRGGRTENAESHISCQTSSLLAL